MNLDGHRRFEERLGEYVLGHLGDDERAELETHLEDCPDCRVELEQIAPVATLLSKADPERLEEPLASPPAHLAERVYERVEQERRRESRRRPAGIGLAAAAVILVALFALSTFFLMEKPGEQVTLQPVAARTALPAGFQNLEATATLRAEDYSTQIELKAMGLTPEQTYAAWLEKEDGTRVPAGGFRAFDEGPITVYLSAALPPDEAAALVLGTPDGETVLRADLNGGDNRDLIVPNLRNKTLKEATEAAGPDFEVKAEDGEQPEGTILEQNPAPGDRARKGTTILVTLNGRRAPVGDHAGPNSPEAEEAPAETTSEPGNDAGSANDAAPAGGTARQSPPAETRVGLNFALNISAHPGPQLLALSVLGPEGARAPEVPPTGPTVPAASPVVNAPEGIVTLSNRAPAAIPGIEATPESPVASPAPKSAPTPEAAPEATPIPEVAPTPEIVPQPQPVLKATPAPETVPQPRPAPEAIPVPQIAPTPQATPEPMLAPEATPGETTFPTRRTVGKPGTTPGPKSGKNNPETGNGNGNGSGDGGNGNDNGNGNGGGNGNGNGGGSDGGNGNGGDGGEITICHKPGTPAEQTKKVSKADLNGHLGHGDTLGPCGGDNGNGGNRGDNGNGCKDGCPYPRRNPGSDNSHQSHDAPNATNKAKG